MSTHKTKFDQLAAKSFISEHVPDSAAELTIIADGETSQAFSFETSTGPRILRVNAHSQEGFLKDQIAGQHLTGHYLPIPTVFEVGEIEPGLYFAISEQAAGKTLDKYSVAEISELMPEIIRTLEAIHVTPPLGEGYGSWDMSANARFSSWRDALRASAEPDDEETTGADFYDTQYHADLRAIVLAHIEHCPEVRALIHDDFGFNNALCDGTKITGVIDWEHSAYGDPLKDVAWLDFWAEKHGYAAAFKQHYQKDARLPDNFDQRIITYKLLIGLGALGFFARSRQLKSYEYTKEIIDRIQNQQ